MQSRIAQRTPPTAMCIMQPDLLSLTFRTVLIAALFGSGATCAEVVETLDEPTYTAYPGRGQTLRQALDNATPIREDGKKFHGHTVWNIRWKFDWWEEGDGRCRITDSETTLTLEITMPELAGGGSAMQQRFAHFRSALHVHEQGHADRARDAAREIDDTLLALPEMDSCDALENEANASARRVLAALKRQQKRYDADTGHGRSQGASPD